MRETKLVCRQCGNKDDVRGVPWDLQQSVKSGNLRCSICGSGSVNLHIPLDVKEQEHLGMVNAGFGMFTPLDKIGGPLK